MSFHVYLKVILEQGSHYLLLYASKVLLSLAETACNSFVQKLLVDCFAKFSSLVCDKSDVMYPKTIFSCQAALTKVMSTCPRLILV